MKLLDRNWRLKNLYSIVDKNGQKIKFRQNAVQLKIDQLQEKRSAILKARQFGVSTNEIIKQFDRTCFSKNFNACILAHEQDGIKKLFRIVARAHASMNEEIRPKLDRGGGSKYEYYFPEINSRIYCDLSSRGDTIHWLHISEAAFIDDENRIKATLEAVPMNGIVTFETTANGMGNYFYDLWMSNPNYKKIFLPWYIFEEYKMETGSINITDEELELKQKAKQLFQIEINNEQIAFRRWKQSELGRLFLQEYPEDDHTCFLSTGNSAMDLIKVEELSRKTIDPIATEKGIKIYKNVHKEGLYVLGADTAEGVGSDFSVAVMIDARSREQVAQYRGQLKPGEFAHKIKEMCEIFSVGGRAKPLVAVERNNHGHAVLLELHDHIGYQNLFVHTDERLGWKTDSMTRPLMIDAFIEGIENEQIKVYDRDTIGECFTLIDNDGKIEAVNGKHDDCIIATAIAIQMCVRQSALLIYQDIESKILL